MYIHPAKGQTRVPTEGTAHKHAFYRESRGNLSAVPGRVLQETATILAGGGDICVFAEASSVRDESWQASSSLKQTCTDDLLANLYDKIARCDSALVRQHS